MSRTLNVIRLQLVNRQTYIWVPLIVLAGAWAISLAIYGIIAAAGVDGPMYGGGAQAPLWYFGVVGVQALTLTFPFSQALSVTRREFFLGTLLTAALTAVLLAIVFMLGGLVEMATHGWGINGWFFTIPWVWENGAFAAGLFYFTIAMLFFVVGFWAATIYKRFGSVVLTAVLIGFAVVLVGLLWLIGINDAWGDVFGWIAAQTALGLTLWGLLLAGVLAAISFVTVRRAVP